MSFPANPNVGDTHSFEDTVYTFNGRNWDRTIIGPDNRTAYTHNVVLAALLTRIAHLEALIEQGLLIID